MDDYEYATHQTAFLLDEFFAAFAGVGKLRILKIFSRNSKERNLLQGYAYCNKKNGIKKPSKCLKRSGWFTIS
jgi:hypothetical protein